MKSKRQKKNYANGLIAVQIAALMLSLPLLINAMIFSIRCEGYWITVENYSMERGNYEAREFVPTRIWFDFGGNLTQFLLWLGGGLLGFCLSLLPIVLSINRIAGGR